jgi:hypothetical protein
MTLDRTAAPAPGPIREFSFPAVERRTFDNGLTLLHARSGVVPLVTVRAVIDAGATVEQAGEVGDVGLLQRRTHCTCGSP